MVVVHAYESVIGEPQSLSPAGAEAGARELLEAGVAAILSDLDGHPPVELRVMHGDPRVALRTTSDAADLLVVGSRGQGVLDRLLLGSVANALAHHPTVPTIVVPDREVPSAPYVIRGFGTRISGPDQRSVRLWRSTASTRTMAS